MKIPFEEPDFSFLEENLQYDYQDSQEVFREMMSLFMEDMRNRENGKVAPDTTGADKFFLDDFITPDMEYEFWAIARDFMKHNFNRLREFDSLACYDNDSPEMSDSNRSMQLTVLNVIYNAAKAGDAYSVELMKYLYKTFHRKEYQKLKRFNKISVDEIFSLSETEDMGCSFETIGRILGMCQFFKIKLDENCSILYLFLNKRHREFDEAEEEERGFLQFREGLFQECVAQIDEWLDAKQGDKKKRAASFEKCDNYWKIENFVGDCFRYNGFPEDFHYRCVDYGESLAGRMARTLAVLRTTFPKREFTLDDVLIYTHIYSLVETIVDISEDMHDNFAQMLGVEDDTALTEGETMLFKPESINFSEKKVSEPSKNKPVNVAPVSIGGAKDDDYLKEIAELRSKISEKESEIKHLRGQYDSLRRTVAEVKEELKKYQDDRDELIALREYVYGLSEDDLNENQVSIEDVKKEIADHSLFIIGGHKNWTNKMKELFPKWRFIGNDSYRTVDDKLLDGAERVYFFTDYISHVVYGKFVSLARTKNIPFGYIHSTNIDAAIRSIYKDYQ